MFGDEETVGPWKKHQMRRKYLTSLCTLGFFIWIMVFGFLCKNNLRPSEYVIDADIARVFFVIYEEVLF